MTYQEQIRITFFKLKQRNITGFKISVIQSVKMKWQRQWLLIIVMLLHYMNAIVILNIAMKTN